jgi:hypothetical protein
LPVVVVASGIHAEAASRRQFPSGAVGEGQLGAGRRSRAVASDPFRDLTMVVRIDGREGRVEPFRGEASASDDSFHRQSDYWIPGLPSDGRLTITTSRPEIGLDSVTVDLRCDSLDDLPERVVALRPADPA